jgi:hypothetical protein
MPEFRSRRAHPRCSVNAKADTVMGQVTAFRALALVGVTGLALAAAGCGGSSGAKVAQVGTTSAAKSATPARFSACMRSHGVPSFPDPGADGTIHVPSTIDDGSPIVRAAYRACHSLAPSQDSFTGQGPTMSQEQLLAFAKCMRSHGVPQFPDPQVVNGHINMHLTAGQIDPNSPIVTAAIAACRSKLGAAGQRGAERLISPLGKGPAGKGAKGK